MSKCKRRVKRGLHGYRSLYLELEGMAIVRALEWASLLKLHVQWDGMANARLHGITFTNEVYK